MLRELQSTLIDIESIFTGNRQSSQELHIRSQNFVGLARRMGYELAELNTELTALRYYRLHLFPHSSIEAEMEAGKLLWQRTQRLKQAHLEGKGALQNSRIASFSNAVVASRASSYLIPWNPQARQVHTTLNGFILWKDWKRTDWNVELLKMYKKNSCVRNCLYYEGLVMRQHLDERREVNNYLLDYHRSLWEINIRLLPFVRLCIDIRFTEKLLRSAPAKLIFRFGLHIRARDSLEHEIVKDILALRKLSTILACLPLNPYLFVARARGYRTKHGSAIVTSLLTTSLMDMLEAQPANIKAVSGSQGLRTYKHDQWKSLTAAGEISAMKQRAPRWETESPYAIAEPFSCGLRLLSVRLSILIRTLRPMRYWWIRGTFSSFRELGDRIQESASHIELLKDDLCALRYYRAYYFPHSVSVSELKLGKALWEEVKTLMREDDRFKVNAPELCLPSDTVRAESHPGF
ncbi:hypothetical protein BDU57DRAFT_527059 [Ampelomyces quisqualis]|uniref:Uncharacterized protein n=1 Tax=Ampelomyces quisqualis TaxID=50730 RepID=A0A6A5QWI2_AMPQU|nr:hypothetical protein BDU57DRAFT_527059 [Ampelomyces quisqualis]